MPDYWPTFHFDPSRFPLSHPGMFEECTLCNPGQELLDFGDMNEV